VARARALIDEHARLRPERDRTYEAASSNPEWPIYSSPAWVAEEAALNARLPRHVVNRIRNKRYQRVSARHGYDIAWEACNDAFDAARVAVRRVLVIRPRTVNGANAKAAALGLALAHDDHIVYPEEVIEANRSDLLRLMAGAT
jgi:hypothetical protein